MDGSWCFVVRVWGTVVRSGLVVGPVVGPTVGPAVGPIVPVRATAPIFLFRL